MSRTIEEMREEEAGKLIEVTPFIQRLVDDWMRSVDCGSFKIIEVRNRERKPNESSRSIFGQFSSVRLKIKVRAKVRDCGKVIIHLEFWKSFNEVHFSFNERELSIEVGKI